MSGVCDQLKDKRSLLTEFRTMQLDGDKTQGLADTITTYQNLLLDLEDMEIVTRWMPITRSALDSSTLLCDDTLYIEEVQKHLDGLRQRGFRHLADYRETRFAAFRLNPTINSLRAIWIRNP